MIIVNEAIAKGYDSHIDVPYYLMKKKLGIIQ